MSRDRGKDAAATYQAGLAAFEQGRHAEAIALLAAIADQRSLPGTLARFYLGQAHLQHGLGELRAGRYAVAARHLTAAREINPGSADLSGYLLACHVGQGRFDLAVAELEKAQQAGDEDELLPIRLAHALVQDGQRLRAVETLEKTIDKSPDRPDLRLQLGLIHAAADDYDAAEQTLRSAVSLAPLDPVVQLNLGLTLAAQDRHAEAVQHLATAQRLQPHDAYTALLLTLAVDAARAGGTETVIQPATAGIPPANRATLQTLGEVIAEDPEFVEAFLSLPESQVDPEIFATLAAILEQALERHPDYADLHFHCSRVYDRLGRTESAILSADQALRINPRYVQAMIQLGRLYAQTDRSTEAIERFNTAVENGGDYPDVHYMLGELYRRHGRTDQARHAYDRALTLNSGHTRARRALEALAVS